MRNLKRALSLGLTAAMISGLMVMGSSAASYADVTSEQNQEAIEVLQSVGIMVGDEKGNFNPDQNVTRNEMAVVMSNLMAYNVATYKNTSPFTDVPSWAEPYVAACYTNGITAGYSDTVYGGNDTVTTAQAALMVMKALGYFQYDSDFGNDWQLSTVSQGNKIDLFEDVDSGVREAMTRNDVAQLVLNALEAGTVEAETNGSISVGDITIVNDVKYNFVTSNRDYAYAISDKIPTSSTSATVGPIVELGEKLYQGDLTKDEDRDDFGRPANIWEYQAKEVGTFEDEADYTFTAKVTSKALYNEVGKTASENYTWSVYVNGDRVDDFSSNDLVKYKADDDSDFNAKQGGNKLTGNGVITEVFVDGTHETVTVAVMNQYAAEVLKVYEDDGTITLSDLAEDGPVDAKDTFEATDFAEDDIVIYTYANDKIQSVYAAERVEGDVTSVRVNSKTNSDGSFVEKDDGDNFVVDGTTYKYNATMKASEMLDTDNVNNGVVAYVDAQGFVAYIDESAVTYDYAYVLSMGTDDDQFGGGDAGKTVYARLVLTDGTMVKAETDVKATDIDKYENHIVSYSKDKNDVYSLTERSGGFELAAATKLDINNGKAGMTLVDDAAKGVTKAVANADTLFIVADSDADMDDYDFTIYTGVKNVPDIDGLKDTDPSEEVNNGTKAVVALKEGSNVAKVVYIQDADVSGAGQVIFAKADKTPKYTKNQDGKIFEIDAIVDGEATTLLVKEGSTAAKRLVTFGSFPTGTAIKLNDDEYLVALKGVTENADGYVTSVRLYDDAAEVLSGTGMEKSKNDIVTLGKNGEDGSWTWTDDVVVAQFNDKNNKGEFESSKMSSIKDDENDKYLAILDDGVIIGLLTQYVENGESGNADIDDSVKSVELSKNGMAVLSLKGFTDKTKDYDYTLYSGDQIMEEGTITVKAGKSTASLKFSDLNQGTSYRLEIGGVSSKNVIYNGKAENGKVDLDSVTEPQAETRKDLEMMFSSLDQDKWGLWDELPTVGLNQTVDGTTIKLSGKLDAINAENYANYKAAIEQWLGGDAANFNAFKTALTEQSYDVENVTEVGFAALVVDGKVAVTCVVNDGDEVRALKSSDATFKWTPSANVGEITVDVSGLEF